MEDLSTIREKTKEEAERLKREVKQRTVGYIVAALGLVAGLAWNDAVRSLIEHLFPIVKDKLLMKFVYAATITMVLVFISVYIIRIFGGDDKK